MMDLEIEGVKLTRRRLMMAVSIGSGALVAAAASVPIIGFFFSPQIKGSPDVWRDVGPLDHFEVGPTVQVNVPTSHGLPWDGVAQLRAVWLRRDNQTSFTAYDSMCTHLGCVVRWLPGPELFMCPCHGGVYLKDGTVAAGPPPHALQNFPVRVRNGRVEVQWQPDNIPYVRLEGGPPSAPCGPCGGCRGNSAASPREGGVA